MGWYRALLLLYPSAFRAEYGGEMESVYRERLLQASDPLSRTAVRLEAVVDVAGNALRVHWDLLRQDLGYGLRSHARSPGLALTAVLVTALGIGAVTAVFSVVDQVFIRPLPFPHSERLVKLWQNEPGYSRMELSPPNYVDWRRMSSSFQSMAAYYVSSKNLVGQGEPVRLDAATVDGELFTVLGVAPALGRALTPEDARPGAEPAVVLAYGLWQSLFGAESGVLGSTVRLDDRVATVVGVMPRSFLFPDPSVDLWTPLLLEGDDAEDRRNSYLDVVARLREGVPLERARAELERITERLEEAYPKENAKTRATVLPLRDEISARARVLLVALFAASGCVLLIACANLAHLLLGRGVERKRELALRATLGAGRERLVRQLLTEAVALAGLGGLIGLALASVALPLLSELAPSTLPLARETALDARVLLFAAVVISLTGVAFGVLPALRVTRTSVAGSLREGPRAGGGRRQRLRSALVIAEVTAAVVLLVASGLLIRALLRIQAVDPGFRTGDVIALGNALPSTPYETLERRTELYSRVLGDVRSLPGVRSAAFISFLPMEVQGGIWEVSVAGADVSSPEEGRQTASLRYVTPDLFATLGIPLRRGRDVRESDTLDAPRVAVVSESFAERYWPGQDPLGRVFQFAFEDRTVVGVVGDVRVRGLERTSEPQVYLPYRQQADRWLVYYAPKELVLRLARPESDPGPIVAAALHALRAADPELPGPEVRTLEAVVDAQTAPRVLQLRVLGVFAGLAVLLAAVGLYGLLSFTVSRRRAEIGVRMAFGARSTDVLSMVLGEGALLASIGAAIGILLGYGAGRMMASLLAGVEPSDALTHLGAAAVAWTMALAGSLVPALRAVRVDPVQSLQGE